jgi:hypothetical protein
LLYKHHIRNTMKVTFTHMHTGAKNAKFFLSSQFVIPSNGNIIYYTLACVNTSEETQIAPFTHTHARVSNLSVTHIHLQFSIFSNYTNTHRCQITVQYKFIRNASSFQIAMTINVNNIYFPFGCVNTN